MERKNKEGYLDLTAAEAIRNVEKEIKMDINQGDIWTADINGKIEEVIILQVNSKYIATMNVKDWEEPILEDTYILKDNRRVDLRRIGFTYQNRLQEFKRILNNDEWRGLEDAVLERLGFQHEIYEEESEQERINGRLKQELMEQKQVNEKLRAELKENQPNTDESYVEARIYKELYEKLLEKVMEQQKAAV